MEVTGRDVAWAGAGIGGLIVVVIILKAANSVAYAGGGNIRNAGGGVSPEFRQAAEAQVRREVISAVPSERALILDTSYQVKAWPDAKDCAGQLPGSLLLGLYTSPPPLITVFEGPTRKAGKTAAEVIHHEIGHRLGYDHSIADIKRQCGVGEVPC